MTASDFHAIYQELIDENPLAIRAVLRILETEFTDQVPTLAVTCEQRPRLLVNLAFLSAHCRTEAQVKAVICHEFLHVLLRHTESITELTPPEHLALLAHPLQLLLLRPQPLLQIVMQPILLLLYF